jgi:predicted CopG family antitoxin
MRSYKTNETLESNRKRHTISINANAYTRLTRIGLFGESFDELISRILDECEGNEKLAIIENDKEEKLNSEHHH